MKKLTSGQAGYIAGFLEGEGSFVINAKSRRRGKDRSKTNLVPAISVGQKDPTVLTYIRDIVEVGKVKYRIRTGFKRGPIYQYLLTNREAIINLIKAVFPHLKSSRTRKRAWCVYTMSKRRNGYCYGRGHSLSDEEWNRRARIYNIWSTTSRKKLIMKEVR